MVMKMVKEMFLAENVSSGTREDFVPTSIVAGSLHLGRYADPIQVAYNAASLALDTERICLITSTSEGKIFYLAGAAADFASHGNATTSLAAALPNSPGYLGEGIYFYPIEKSDLTVCVVSARNSLDCFVGKSQEVERYVQRVNKDLKLPVRRLDGGRIPADFPVWKTFTEYERVENRKFVRRVLLSALGISVVMSGAWLVSSLFHSTMVKDDAESKQSLIKSVEDVVKNMDDASMVEFSVWNEFQRISTFVLSHQGKLVKFRYQNQKVAWTMALPEYTTGQEIDRALGRENIVTTKKDGTIFIAKGDVEK